MFLLKLNMRETFEIARENLDLMKEKNKKIYDKSLNQAKFKAGELVQLINEAVRQGHSMKLGPQWFMS